MDKALAIEFAAAGSAARLLTVKEAYGRKVLSAEEWFEAKGSAGNAVIENGVGIQVSALLLDV